MKDHGLPETIFADMDNQWFTSKDGSMVEWAEYIRKDSVNSNLKKVDELFDWIMDNKRAVLSGMLPREQEAFTELFGAARIEFMETDNE
jgi:hypothetical protein